MLLTKDYILKHRTKAGSWTKSQIEALGLKWPPKSGWIKKLEGRFIGKYQMGVFESALPAEEANILNKVKFLVKSMNADQLRTLISTAQARLNILTK